MDVLLSAASQLSAITCLGMCMPCIFLLSTYQCLLCLITGFCMYVLLRFLLSAHQHLRGLPAGIGMCMPCAFFLPACQRIRIASVSMYMLFHAALRAACHRNTRLSQAPDDTAGHNERKCRNDNPDPPAFLLLFL